MKNVFSTAQIHTVTEAKINFYKTPFVHPARSMKEHDFIYLLSGEWSLGQNGVTYPLKKDSLLILTAGNSHYGVAPCTADTKTMYFHLSCEEGDGLADGEEVPDGIEILTDASGNKTIEKLFADVVNAKLAGNLRKANLLAELLLCELRAETMCFGETEVAQRIQSIIHGYPERFFGNRELAEMLHVSVKTAENKFKASFGKTIHQYTLDFKIREAKSYFDRYRDISVKEVAYNLGFCDEYHFSKQFCSHTGLSPSAYKKGKNQSEK